MSRTRRWLSILAVATIIAIAGFCVMVAYLVGSSHRHIGVAPANLPADNVIFSDTAGRAVHGWFVHGTNGRGAVLLLHGVRADRRSMIDRATFLHDAGYTVLLIDFQAAGESPGRTITFGYQEAADVTASLRYLRQRVPDEHIGIIGTSMGGAATILSGPDVDASAVILEQVYPTIDEAIRDRLAIRLGPAGRLLSPVLLAALHPFLGVYPEQLRPIDRIGQLSMPKLLIVGDRDEHTPLDESYAMLKAAKGPKAIWVVHGARHVDLYRYVGAEYKTRVLRFFDGFLPTTQNLAGTTAISAPAPKHP